MACCGTKDASIRGGLAQVSSSVIGVRMVNTQGEVEEVSEDSNPERLREIRSSYGLLGVIFEVTFRIQPVVTLRYEVSPSKPSMFELTLLTAVLLSLQPPRLYHLVVGTGAEDRPQVLRTTGQPRSRPNLRSREPYSPSPTTSKVWPRSYNAIPSPGRSRMTTLYLPSGTSGTVNVIAKSHAVFDG